MDQADTTSRCERLAARYPEVRGLTDTLAGPLSPEDQMVQSMPDVSPTKWHRGHTSWFFETFLLEPELPGYVRFDPGYSYIFNSYYEIVGPRHPRTARGLISRPSADEVAAYRRHVDLAMGDLLGGAAPIGNEILDLVELGLHHEQQHQELLLMDIKHVLSCNPLQPAYSPAPEGARAGVRADGPARAPGGVSAGVGRGMDVGETGTGTGARTAAAGEATKPGWIEHQGGAVEIGHRGGGFAFDNERPRHLVQLSPFAVADRPVNCGEWLAFVDDGGYFRPELWLSDGWAQVRQLGWAAPLYWTRPEAGEGSGEPWKVFTLAGPRPVEPEEPVCHISYYEADAFARWSGQRLPTEAEWETVAAGRPVQGNLLDPGTLHPAAAAAEATRLFGDVWEWTASAYSPYPGFRVAAGAVGEYNGKFMVNQYVLRGGSCVTPPGHLRVTYRNFFPAGARWAFSGVRLARDL